MTVSEIIEQVRWCIDEESASRAEISSATTDDARLDNIIRAKIKDALIFCTSNCSPDKFSGNADSISTGTDVYSDVTLDSGKLVVTLKDNVLRIVRVRAVSWKRSVSKLTEEYSDVYLQQSDEIAKATAENPVVAVIRSYPMRLELYPGTFTDLSMLNISAVMTPEISTEGGSDDSQATVNVPEKLKAAFIYYLAFLVLSAFQDPWSKQMYDISLMNLKAASENEKS